MLLSVETDVDHCDCPTVQDITVKVTSSCLDACDSSVITLMDRARLGKRLIYN